MDPKHIFGQNLRRLRTAKGISQEELALRAGLHRTYIGSVERGERNICLENMVNIAGALGVQMAELVAGITPVSSREG
jgi:transcriptional regulator with XRE-family HTH domain